MAFWIWILCSFFVGYVFGTWAAATLFNDKYKKRFDAIYDQFDKDIQAAEKIIDEQITKQRAEIKLVAGEGSNGKGRL